MRALAIIAASLLLACLALLGACTDRAASPPSDQTEPRIAVLAPALAVTLRDMGLADSFVARHGWDIWSDQSLPMAGEQSGIDYETLVRVRPTHVLLNWGSRELPERLTNLARERGWIVKDYPLLTLDDVRAAANDIAAIFDRPAPAIDFGERIAAERGPVPAEVGRVLLLESTQPPAALGPGSAHQQILENLGYRSATPAGEGGAPYIMMDAEDVQRLAPDTIVLIHPRRPGTPDMPARVPPEHLANLLGRIADLDIPAVRDGRVFLLDGPEYLLPSTALSRYAAELDGVLRGALGSD